MTGIPIENALAIARQNRDAGKFPEAAAAYRRILSAHPKHAQTQYELGMMLLEADHSETDRAGTDRADVDRQEADDLLQQSVDARSLPAKSYFNLGNAWASRGKLTAAIDAYRVAISLRPDVPETHNNLGNAFKQKGELEEAIASYRRALKLRPNYATAHNNLGNAQADNKDWQSAITSFRQAIALKPDYAEAYFNLANTLSDHRQFDEAVLAYKEALRIQPDYVDALTNLGIAYKDAGRWDDAIDSYRKALAIEARNPDIIYDLANALSGKGNLTEAIACYAKALEIRPGFTEAINNLGSAIGKQDRLDEAIACFRKALALRPDYPNCCNNLANALKDSAKLAEADVYYAKALALKPEVEAVHSNQIYCRIFDINNPQEAIAGELQKFNANYVRPLRDKIPIHRNDCNPNRRLRIGYVSADFRDHCQMFFMLPLLANHDRAQVEIYCYSNVSSSDAVTAKHQALADVWRPIYAVDDEAAAKQINDDQIDILFDLTLHMASNRLLLFARKPAPVQITWLGYPGSTGVETIDYRLTDPHLDPPGANDPYYTEKSLYLPETFWCYDPMETVLALNDLPALENGYVTFGCLNNFCKINSQTLRLWAKVMCEVKNSRLILLSPLGSIRQWVVDELNSHGIATSRIQFEFKRPRRNYLELYHQIDLVLDTFVYNGHTTSLDGLWMGVPMVTRFGWPAVSRAGLSQLTNLNLQHLASDTEEGFFAAAVNLANDLPALQNLRKTLRQRMEASPLMDGQKFARGFEQACRNAWMQWCAKQETPAQIR